ncbi:MAG: hypothetical protein HN348_29430, partial [Proteobacteria bacterium]|nr:hypothetical protein [Pseudomonadota bacterium]
NWSFDPDEYDELLDEAASRAPQDATAIRLFAHGPDGVRRRLSSYLPNLEPPPDKEGGLPSSIGVDHPGESSGFLDDRAVYLSQCHGWIWYDSLDRFATQRGNNFDTVEDFHNPEAMNQYLANYLENAGAKVFMVKERDLNPLWAFADNNGDGYSESGSGFTDVSDGFVDSGTWAYGENPFDQGSSRSFSSSDNGVATWIPDVPAYGYYAVYVTYQSDSSNSKSAHYRITHQGGEIDRYLDQTVHGTSWRYLETLWLPAGTDGLTIELIGDGTDGAKLNADAVRIGGGEGVVSRHSETTERPRWEGGAIMSGQFNGAPTSVYDPYWNGNGSDPSVRSRWSAWEHPSGEDAVYLSWHTNATATGGARGTVTYYAGNECSSPAVDGSLDLSEIVQEELIDSITTFWESDWYDRGVKTACFSEVAPYNNDEMPSTLVELAFHDTEEDVWHIKQPKFRLDSSRAMYRGIVRYFAERDGITPTFLPEPPTDIRAINTDNGVEVSWKPGPSGAPLGDSADEYVLYSSLDGRSWDNGTIVDDTSTLLTTEAGDNLYVRVTGTNEGGESFPSNVVGARHSPDGTAPILVVDAFDRLDSGLLEWEDPHYSIGMIVRMNTRRMNTYDIIVPH